MEINPDTIFPTEGIIPRERQIGREGEIVRLAAITDRGTHSVLVAVRRFGKTSVVRAALLDCQSRGALGLSIDVRADAISSERDMVRKLLGDAQSVGLVDPDAQPTGDYLERLTRLVAEHPPTLQAALEMLNEQGATAGRRVILFVDEAQDLVRWDHDQSAQQALAGAVRQPMEHLTLVFAGSRTSSMELLFAPGRPLHLAGADFVLAPISRADWTRGLKARFLEAGYTVSSDAIEQVLDASGGHPLKTMQVCNRALTSVMDVDGATIDASVGTAIYTARRTRAWRDLEDDSP